MRKFLFTCFLLVASAAMAQNDPWKAAEAKARNAVVTVKNSEGSCTGFVINPKEKYVMSAGHCYSEEKIWVDRVLSSVVAYDDDKDLMVLKVENLDPSKTALRLSDNDVYIRQEVMSVGFGYGLERPQFRAANVSDTAMVVPDLSGPFVAVNVSFTPGQSGGPVIDINGDVVSIVQRGDGGTLGFGVDAKTIKERLGRFFGGQK